MTPPPTPTAGDVDRGRRRRRRRRGGARPARRGRRRSRPTRAPRGPARRARCGEGDVVPVQVGRQPDQPGAAPDHARHADRRADQGRGGGRLRHDLADQADGGRPARPRAGRHRRGRAADVPPRPTRATDHPVDAQVDGHDERAVVAEPDSRRGPAGAPGWSPPRRGDRRAPRARPTRPAMVCGSAPSPWSGRHARCGPRRWTCRSRVPRLCRRTASWLVPVPGRGGDIAAQTPAAERRRRRSRRPWPRAGGRYR